MPDTTSTETTTEITTQPTRKPLPLAKKISIVDTIVTNVAKTDATELINNTNISLQEKKEAIQDQITILQAKLKGLKQVAATERCLASIKELKQHLHILSSDGNTEVIDEDEDMDTFDLITLNAKQVACKRSNALIVTGDAGVGKTMTVIQAISFLNPVQETEIALVNTDENGVIIDPDDITNQTEEDDDEDEEDDEVEEQKEETATKRRVKLPIKGGTTKVVRAKVNSRNNLESRYYIASGTCTSAALYELLFIHRHKLLIFDDFDAVFKDDDSINLLKAALDTYPIRELSKMTKGNSFNSLGMSDIQMQEEYEITGKVPNQFKFSGNIIFISNIHEDRFDKALISRALHVEVRLTKAQMIERMHKLMLEIRPEVPVDFKLEALHHLEFLTNNFPCKFDLNLRELIHAIDYKTQYPDDTVTINGKEVLVWKKLLKKRIVKSKTSIY
jgi:hypothetical protein